MTSLAVFVLLFFAYSLASRRLEQTIVSAPILFTVAGMLMALASPAILGAGLKLDFFRHLAEIGLVLLLYSDASRIDLSALSSIRYLPVRLLTTGMLLTILFGAIAARLVFPHISIWEAGILAAILAPTDAGLGQVIVSSPRVPTKIRQALNVEAGLNDGLSVPFLLFFIALAAADTEGQDASLKQFILEQLGFGALVGVGIGLIGGWLLGLASRKEWIAELFQQVAVITLPLLCLLMSEIIGASMFIAAFVAGLTVQIGFKETSRHSLEFSEELGQILNLSVFFLFGLFVVRDWQQFDLASVLYAALSLTVVRMVPVAIALIGTGLNPTTVVFMGWFGPRGLASIVLGAVYLEREAHLSGEPTIRVAVMMTVLFSIFLHGLSAVPGIAIYARKNNSSQPAAPEKQVFGPNGVK